MCEGSLKEEQTPQGSGGGANPTPSLHFNKKEFKVEQIPYQEVLPWFLKKHYAHRVPSVSYCFGLYWKAVLSGVCSFGMPPNYQEMKAWEPIDILELNRLVINDDCPKNSASFFISKCIKLLPKPKVLISYSDFRQGHHGYIYQATNWFYTGIGGEGCRIYIMKDGTERHQRHEDKIDVMGVERIEKTKGKARYYFFHGETKDIFVMKNKLRFQVMGYPKGENQRYDASYKPSTQGVLF